MIWILGALACTSVLFLAILWRFQERIVFQPPRGVLATVGDAVEVSYEATDGQRLTGFIVGREEDGPARSLSSPVAGRPTVLAFHGNAEVAAWLLPWARELSRRVGARVFLAEYRGYADLPGSPSYSGIQADALAALTFLRNSLGVAPDRCVLFGHSLGSAVAAELAVVAHPAALILQSPFSSAAAMAGRLFVPPIPGFWRRFSRVHYDTSSVVRGLDCPVFVAHGEWDRVVPVEMGRSVHRAARVPGALLVCAGAGHNDVPDLGGERYWSWISAAVSRARPVDGGPVRDAAHG